MGHPLALQYEDRQNWQSNTNIFDEHVVQNAVAMQAVANPVILPPVYFRSDIPLLYIHVTVRRYRFLFNNQPDAPIIQIYSVTKLYMFRATSLPIIRSFLLYILHW